MTTLDRVREALRTADRPRNSDVQALVDEIDNAYTILCSGKPPYSPREANARNRLQEIGANMRSR